MQFLKGFALLVAVVVPQVAAQCSGVTGRYTPKMGTGYKSSVLATGLRTPRGIAMDSAGQLLVVEQNGGGVKLLKLKEQGETVCVESSKQLVANGAVSFFSSVFGGRVIVR
jgi:glucose/arabinose dehydrogenase